MGICSTNWFSVMAICTSSPLPRTRISSVTALRGTMPVTGAVVVAEAPRGHGQAMTIGRHQAHLLVLNGEEHAVQRVAVLVVGDGEARLLEHLPQTSCASMGIQEEGEAGTTGGKSSGGSPTRR